MILESSKSKNYNQNWDKNGNIYYTDENGQVVDFKVNPFVKLANTVNSNALNNGDWITFSKKYAQVHGDSNLGGDYRIIEQKVSPNEVWWDGNDIREWGYDNGLPQKPDIMLSIQKPYYQDVLPANWKEARKIRDLGYDGIITKDGNYLIFEKDQIKRLGDL